MFELIEEMVGLRRKLKGQCPCGYGFETFSSKNDAISMVKSHVESFHDDFLPFGITKDEALTLLMRARRNRKLAYNKTARKNITFTSMWE